MKDMNRDRWKKLMYGLVAALLLPACSQDELAENSTALPEGEYPLQIGSVTLTTEVSEQPWTRVSENPTDGMSSVWKNGDKIGVRIGDNEETGIYVVNVDETTGNITVIPEKAVYWKDKQPATITAWYPLNEKLDFTHQDEGLTYLLKGTSTVNADYNTSANLAFTHQLAKVRVELEGTKATEVTAVTVRSYPTSTHSYGTLDSQDKSLTPQYVPMRRATYGGVEYWEANLRPGWLEPANTFEVAKVEGDPVRVTLDDRVTINAGQVHTITIGVEQAPIDLGTCEGTTLTVSGEAVITGKNDNLQIILQAGSDVTLQDAELSYTGLSPILCQGDASLTLAGSNTLTATSVAWNFETGTGIYVESGTLTIDAESGASLAINRTGGGTNQQYGAGIGVTENANLIINGGTIIVNDIDESSGYDSGAGIGGLYDETSGNITIAGGTITIGQPSWWSAGIGGGGSGNCKNITITGSSTVITVAKGSFNDHYIGCSKLGGNVEGTITIGGGATVNGVKYYDHTGPL